MKTHQSATPSPSSHHEPGALAIGRLALVSLAAALLLACGGPASSGAKPSPLGHKPPPDSHLANAGGQLGESEIQMTIAQHEAGFRNCFQRNEGTFVAGEAVLEFLIGASGRTEAVWIKQSTLGSWRIEDCLVQTARFFEFPPPAGNERARFAYPVNWNDPGRRLTTPVEPRWGFEAIRKHESEIKRCRRDHDFDGEFFVTAYVGRLGQVLAAGFHSPKPPPIAFPACIVQSLEELRFPNPGQRVVKYGVLIEDIQGR